MEGIVRKIGLAVLEASNTAYRCVKRDSDCIILNTWMNVFCGKVLHRNFGDDLNFYLIKSLTNKNIFNYPNFYHLRNVDNIMCIGSIIEAMTNQNSIIWGSGALYGDKKLFIKPKRVLAVRGPLTRQYLLSQGVDCPAIYGDPALLLPMVYNPVCSKKFMIGIIPHRSDSNNIQIVKLKKKYKNRINIIGVR